MQCGSTSSRVALKFPLFCFLFVVLNQVNSRLKILDGFVCVRRARPVEPLHTIKGLTVDYLLTHYLLHLVEAGQCSH